MILLKCNLIVSFRKNYYDFAQVQFDYYFSFILCLLDLVLKVKIEVSSKWDIPRLDLDFEVLLVSEKMFEFSNIAVGGEIVIAGTVEWDCKCDDIILCYKKDISMKIQNIKNIVFSEDLFLFSKSK